MTRKPSIFLPAGDSAPCAGIDVAGFNLPRECGFAVAPKEFDRLTGLVFVVCKIEGHAFAPPSISFMSTLDSP